MLKNINYNIEAEGKTTNMNKFLNSYLDILELYSNNQKYEFMGIKDINNVFNVYHVDRMKENLKLNLVFVFYKGLLVLNNDLDNNIYEALIPEIRKLQLRTISINDLKSELWLRISNIYYDILNKLGIVSEVKKDQDFLSKVDKELFDNINASNFSYKNIYLNYKKNDYEELNIKEILEMFIDDEHLYRKIQTSHRKEILNYKKFLHDKVYNEKLMSFLNNDKEPKHQKLIDIYKARIKAGKTMWVTTASKNVQVYNENKDGFLMEVDSDNLIPINEIIRIEFDGNILYRAF